MSYRQYPRVYFSPGPDCLNAIVRACLQAEKSIDICVFTITDNRIKDAVIAAYSHGTDVRIITDDHKQSDDGSDIRELESIGIEIRTDRVQGHMHNKYAIFDEYMVLTGSYNWTRGAEASNYENLVQLYDENIVTRFVNNFNGLWKEFE